MIRRPVIRHQIIHCGGPAGRGFLGAAHLLQKIAVAHQGDAQDEGDDLVGVMQAVEDLIRSDDAHHRVAHRPGGADPLVIVDERHLAEDLAGTEAIVDRLVVVQGNPDLDLALVDDIGAIADIPAPEDLGPRREHLAQIAVVHRQAAPLRPPLCARNAITVCDLERAWRLEADSTVAMLRCSTTLG